MFSSFRRDVGRDGAVGRTVAVYRIGFARSLGETAGDERLGVASRSYFILKLEENRRLIEAKEEAIHAQLSTGEPEFGREMMRTIEQGAIASPSVSASIAREQACSAAIRAAFDAGVVTSPIEVCALSYQRNLCSTLSADLQFNFLQIV